MILHVNGGAIQKKQKIYFMKPRQLLSCLLLFLAVSMNVLAQQDIGAARSLAAKGMFKQSIELYSAILANNDADMEARIGRAYTYSWAHQFTLARKDFEKVLKNDAANFDAQKGLAYIQLWSGSYHEAAQSFSRLIKANPATKELYIARGLAQLNNGEQMNARASFLGAQKMDPSDQEVKGFLEAVRTSPTILDADVIGGISIIDGDTKTGLRLVQVSSQVLPKLQLMAKYDNSLSLDNASLLLNKINIPYYAGAVTYQWNRFTTTRTEVGGRNINSGKASAGSTEMQYGIEQLFYFRKGTTVKAGAAFITPEEGENAYVLSAGIGQTFHKKFTARIDYYYANRNIQATTDNRIVISGDYRLPGSVLINAGFYAGKSSSDLPEFSGNMFGYFGRTIIPVGNKIAFQVGVTGENSFLQTLFTANAGLRFRLEK